MRRTWRITAILIVQDKPGFPLLRKVAKFQQRLNLEKDFMASYWDQQLDDLRAVLHWLKMKSDKRPSCLPFSWAQRLPCKRRNMNGIL